MAWGYLTEQAIVGYLQRQTGRRAALYGYGKGYGKPCESVRVTLGRISRPLLGSNGRLELLQRWIAVRDKAAMKTKGEIEAEISRSVVQFEIDYMGRGPREVRTHIIEDMVLVRLKGVLTPAEEQLTKSAEGGELVKKMRATLIEKARPLLYKVIGDITGSKVFDLHTDISILSGERVFVFALSDNLERSLQHKKDP